MVAPGDSTQAAIMSVLNSSSPNGKTSPIALALCGTDNYLKSIDPGKTKYVMVITDGKENCNAPVATAPVTCCQNLSTDGFKTYVVGFGASADVDATVLKQHGRRRRSPALRQHQVLRGSGYTQLDAALKAIAGTVTCCGDGILQSNLGELCDTGITSGTGKCPTLATATTGTPAPPTPSPARCAPRAARTPRSPSP